jgi:hypothetical protein
MDVSMARRMRAGLAVVALTLAAPYLAFAGNSDRKGTGGATELRIPVGPRGSALGGAVASYIDGVESIYWNPAGLGSLERTEFLFSHSSWIASMELNYAAVATKVGGLGTFGVSVKALSIGDIIITTEDAPDGTGEIINPTFATITLGWGRTFTDRVLFGAGVSLVSEQILSAAARGIAFDFGVQYLTGWRGLRFGIAMKNFGPNMQFQGADFEFNQQPSGTNPQSGTRTSESISAEFELPSYFQIGANYDLLNTPEQYLVGLLTFQSNNFQGDGYYGALEWKWKKGLALRGFYFGSVTTSDQADGTTSTTVASGDDVYDGFGLGAGTWMMAGTTRVGVDASWRGVSSIFDDQLEVGVTLGF